MSDKSLIQKILQFPLTKIILSIAVIGIILTITNKISDSILDQISISNDIKELIASVIACLVSVLVYSFFFKYYDKRQVTELSLKPLFKSLFIGLGIGLLLQSTTILLMYLMGSYEVIDINPVTFMIAPLSMALVSGILEEVLMRGIIFKNIEDKLGSYITLALSALAFGLLHIGNPNVNIMSGLIIGLEAGVLLGAAYMYSRNLWLPMGLHIAWIFAQSGIYGATTSGIEVSKSLLKSNINGADWLTGGALGPEGSVQAVVFCCIGACIFLYLCHKEDKIVQPYWKK